MTSANSTGITRFTLLSILAALGVGLAVGFFTGPAARPAPDGVSANSPTESATTTDHAPRTTLANDPVSAGALPPPRTEADAAEIVSRLRSELNPVRRHRTIDELCAGLDPTAIRMLFTTLGRKVEAPFEREIREALVSRWAELEPLAAADFVAQSDDPLRLISLRSLMRTWAAHDPDAAQEWALRPRDHYARQESVTAVLEILALDDPQAALDLLNGLPPTQRQNFYVTSLFYRMAQRDLASAAELAGQLPTHKWREQAVESVAAHWGQTDPEKALRWFLQNATINTRFDSNRMDDQATQVALPLLRKWLDKSPEEAVAFVDAQPPGALRSALIAKLGSSWGEVNPAAAADWLATRPKSREGQAALKNLIASWSEADPESAGNFILTRPSERSRDALFTGLAAGWLERDAAGALAWAQRQSAPEVERFVAAPALGAMAANDLAHADRYLAQVKTPEAQDALISAAGRAVAQQDPAAAANWLLQMGQDHNVGGAMSTTVSLWAIGNPDAVRAWLKEQPAGPTKDAALTTFIVQHEARDLPAAAAMALTIAGEARRTDMVNRVVTRWATKDSAAARAWVVQQNFAAARQEELLKTLERANR